MVRDGGDHGELSTVLSEIIYVVMEELFRFSSLTWRLGALTGGDITNSYVIECLI